MAAVETSSLRHRYGERTALDGLDIAWPEDRIIGLLGPNGSGKSTLFRILSTALVPTEGHVRVLGEDVRTRPEQVRRSLGTVFQSPALDPELTVSENLDVFAALHGVERRDAAVAITGLLRELEISDRADERVDRLSGGLRRRADLARSLVHAPRLLLLDEPTGGLDPTARAVFWEALSRLRATRPLTLLVSTHSFEEAAACEYLAILDEGRIAIEGRPSDLVRALGEEALWVDADDPEAVLRALPEGDSAQVSGRRVRITGPSLTDSLIGLRERCGRAIHALELRPPGLADVYEAATGRRWNGMKDPEAGEPS